jgi:predicted 3-demethylubiquinone-9 3-methyltransferase (glyoxalase superfamily)
VSHSIRTVLWFNGRGREAAAFYCSLIPNSRVETSFSGDAGPAPFDVIDFTLNGVPYQILDAGPNFPLSECVSILVQTPDQAETDRLWAALTADGGAESQCGWLKDRFGLSWQIVPSRAFQLFADPAKSPRVMAALMDMRKIELAALEAAAEASDA